MISFLMFSGSFLFFCEIVGLNIGEILFVDYFVVMYSGCGKWNFFIVFVWFIFLFIWYQSYCNFLFLIDVGVEGLRCLSNCLDCYQGKLVIDCYFYDKYGNFLGCWIFVGNVILMRVLNDIIVVKGMFFVLFVSVIFIC